MKQVIIAIFFSTLFFWGCTPSSKEISIPQSDTKLCIASTAFNSNTAIVAVSYSISSLTNLNDTSGTIMPLSSFLADSALVILTNNGHNDTLIETIQGIYVNTQLQLTSGTSYTLRVKDKKGNSITAVTTYQTAAPPDLIMPTVIRAPLDTTIQLKINVTDNSQQTNYYIMAYDNINSNTVPSQIGSSKFPVLSLSAIKKLEVFSNAEAVNGVISKTFIIGNVGSNDTLFVHYGRIDKGYYDYLISYKNTGSLINQIVSEPINLPTNINIGVGYFELYDVQRTLFDLKKF